MIRGARSISLAGCIAVAACAGNGAKLEVRAKDPSAAIRKAGGSSLDLARGQLALGNVGLALEGFRRAARELPMSAEPLRGIANCYEAMGRHDLAQTNYEAALAFAPRDLTLLKALAQSMERRGKIAQAAAVRAEIGQLSADQLAVAAAPPVESQAVASSASTPQTIAVADTKPIEAPSARQPQIQEAMRAAPLPPATVEPAQVAASSVTIALPPPRSEPRPQPAPKTMDAPVRIVANKPKLERMSPGEVTLLTATALAWRPVVVAQSRQSTTVRFVPLQSAAARPTIRLLNAARRQGLAAYTRDYLVERGWRRIAVGDASQQRERSIVVYPAKHAIVGRRLAAQFGFQSQAARDANEFVVLLGRDAAAKARPRKLG